MIKIPKHLPGIVALIAAVLGSIQLTDYGNPTAFAIGIFWLSTAIVIFWAALALKTPLNEPAAFMPTVHTEPPLQWRYILSIIVGCIALILLANTNGDLLRIRFPNNQHVQFGLLCLACAALIWGFGGGWRGLTLRLTDHWEIGILFCLTLLAFILRAVNLEGTIPGFVDEVSFSELIHIFDGQNPVYLLQPMNSVAAFPRLYVYFEWFGVKLLGQNLNGLRVVSAIFGTLTIPVLYWLCKHLFNRQIAFASAAALAVLPIHVQMSRVGLNNVADPFFGTLGFALLARGLRYDERVNFAAAGVMLGLAQYFHEAGRLTFPVIALVWMGYLLIYDRHLRNRLLITLFCMAVLAVPFYWSWHLQEMPFAARVADVGLRSDYWTTRTDLIQILNELLGRTLNTLARLLHRPEVVLYYAGNTPYILYIVTPFLTLGFAYALWRWLKPGSFLILLWLAVPLGGIVLFLAEIMSPRTTVFLPAIAVLIGIGVVYGLQAAFGTARKRIIPGVLIALCMAQMVYYFGVHLPLFTRQMYFSQPWQQLIFPARMAPFASRFYIIAHSHVDQFYVNQVLRFMAGYDTYTYTAAPDEITAEYLLAIPRSTPLVFFVEMPNPGAMLLLPAVLPDIIGPIMFSGQEPAQQWFVMYVSPQH